MAGKVVILLHGKWLFLLIVQPLERNAQDPLYSPV